MDSNLITSALDAARSKPVTDVQRLVQMAATDKTSETAKKFQAVFTTLLVKEMRKSLGEGGFFGDGAEGDIYAGWLDQHVGQSMADRDALHLEELVRRGLEHKVKSQAPQGEGTQS